MLKSKPKLIRVESYSWTRRVESIPKVEIETRSNDQSSIIYLNLYLLFSLFHQYSY